MITHHLAAPVLAVLLAGIPLTVATSEREPPPAPPPAAPDAAPEDDPNLLALVNDWPVYVEDLEQVLTGLHAGVREGSRPDFDLDSLIRQRLTGDALLAAEAAALGMGEENPIADRLDSLRVRLARERLEREAVTDAIEIDDEAVRRVFDAEYRTVTLHMATVPTREAAEELSAELAGGADFEAIARERSIDAFQGRGGLAENVPYINLSPEIAAALFSLEPGQLSEPLLTETGWAVVRVESFAAAEEERLPEVEDRIRRLLRLRRAEQLSGELLAALHATHRPEFDEEAIAAIGCERRADGGLWPVVQDPERVLVRIGERRILAQDLGGALLDRWRNVRSEDAALAAKPIVLDRLVGGELLVAEALARGYGDTVEVERAQHALLTRLLVKKYLGEVVSRQIKITREEMERFYEENRDDFRKPPRLQIGQITVATRPEAEEVAALLRDGADLAWLARRRSLDRFRDAGGDRGWVVANLPVEPFGTAMATAAPGEVFGPEGWEERWVVARVGAVEDQGHYSLQEVSGNVRSRLSSEKFGEILDRTFATLRERAEIVYFEDPIDKLRISAGETAGAPATSHGGGH